MEDHFERGARLSEPVGPFEPLPPRPRLLNPWLLLAGFAVLVVAVALVRNAPSAPPAKGSCTAPAFTLSTASVRVDGVVRWSATGPEGSRVVLGADTAPDTLTVPTDDRLAGPLPLSGCKASGQFGARLAAGDHVVTAFLVRRDGTVSRAGTARLTVTAP